MVNMYFRCSLLTQIGTVVLQPGVAREVVYAYDGSVFATYSGPGTESSTTLVGQYTQINSQISSFLKQPDTVLNLFFFFFFVYLPLQKLWQVIIIYYNYVYFTICKALVLEIGIVKNRNLEYKYQRAYFRQLHVLANIEKPSLTIHVVYSRYFRVFSARDFLKILKFGHKYSGENVQGIFLY